MNKYDNYDELIIMINNTYKNYFNLLLNELKYYHEQQFNLLKNDCDFVKKFYKLTLLNKKKYPEYIKTDKTKDIINIIIKKDLFKEVKIILRRENNKNLIKIKNDIMNGILNNPELNNIINLNQIKNLTSNFLNEFNDLKKQINIHDLKNPTNVYKKEHQYELYKKLKLETIKYSLKMRDYLYLIIINIIKLNYYKKNNIKIENEFKKNIDSISNFLKINLELKEMIYNYIDEIDIINFENKKILRKQINQQLIIFNYFLNSQKNEDLDFGFENLENYQDISNNDYYENKICIKKNNNFGIWVIIKVTTFETKYIYKKLVRKTENYEEKIINSVGKMIQEMDYKKYNGKGTTECYSLYNILNGQLIYCMGNINRENFYNKIYEDESTMYKIPKICEPNEINGPILGVNYNIENNKRSEFNYCYFTFNKNKNIDNILTENGDIYFSPLTKYHKKLYENYTIKNSNFKKKYNGIFKKKNINSTFLYWWNILKLYKYNYYKELKDEHYDEIQNEFNELLNDMNIKNDIKMYIYIEAYKSSMNEGFLLDENNKIIKNNINKLFNKTKILINNLYEQILKNYGLNNIKYISPLEKIIIGRYDKKYNYTIVGYKSTEKLNTMITLTVPPKNIEKIYNESIKNYLINKYKNKFHKMKNKNKKIMINKIKSYVKIIRTKYFKYFYLPYSENYLINSINDYKLLYNMDNNKSMDYNEKIMNKLNNKILNKNNENNYGLLNSILLGEILCIWGQNNEIYNYYKNFLNNKNKEFDLYLSIVKSSIIKNGLILNKNQYNNWLIPSNFINNDSKINVENRKIYIIGKYDFYKYNDYFYKLMNNDVFINWYGYYLYLYSNIIDIKNIDDLLENKQIKLMGGFNNSLLLNNFIEKIMSFK